MAKKPDPLLAKLAEAASAGSVRSKLTVWMTENHDGFAELLRLRGAAWRQFAQVFVAEGLLPHVPDYDAGGDTAERAWVRAEHTAKRTWSRVRQRENKPRRSKVAATSAPVASMGGTDAAAPSAPDQAESDGVIFAGLRQWKDKPG